MARVLVAVAVCLVSACVGGGGDGVRLPNALPDSIPPADTVRPTDPPSGAVDYHEVAYASNEPVWDITVSADDDGNQVWGVAIKTDGNGILIGTKEAVSILERENAELDESITAREMMEFLMYEGRMYSHRRFVTRWGTEPPVVRMGAEVSEEDRRDIMLAVRMVNSALPPDWQISVESTGADVPEDWRSEIAPLLDPRSWIKKSEGYTAFGYNATDEGYIDILFEEVKNWIRRSSNPTTIGKAITAHPTRGQDVVLSTRIYVDPERMLDDQHRVSVLLEEILHALGRPDHRYALNGVPEDEYPNHDTIMQRFLGQGFLGIHDEAALLAVYGKPMPIGTFNMDEQKLLNTWGRKTLEEILERQGLEYEDLLDIGDLGPWSAVHYHASDEMTLSGEDPLRFGAIWRYSQPRPYMMGMDASGTIPDTDGSASWRGRLIGLTPAAETVRGDMGMTVDFGATVTGNLEFTNLEKGEAMKDLADDAKGTPWTGGDGTVTESRLEYGITVETASGMFFQSGNGANDGGLITGAFFGPNHEGVGGTLRRSDLAGGFGGVKQ